LNAAPPPIVPPNRRRVRTWLTLGRVSNLPTAWSNCLAGWWLGGAGAIEPLPFLLLGATLLYLGGMFLNDAFDVDFDRARRPERPIPAGWMSLDSVWIWGLGLLGAGVLCLILLGTRTGGLGVALLASILVYDALHKITPISPLLMGLCRFFLYIVAASTGSLGVTGQSIWCALALALYVTGLSFAARHESRRDPAPLWPVAAPLLLAILMNAGPSRKPALLLSAALALWILRCLPPALRRPDPDLRRTISGLLAGIVLVDWLAMANAPWALSLILLSLFGLANLLQRIAPAT
jgi:hypothetical protein